MDLACRETVTFGAAVVCHESDDDIEKGEGCMEFIDDEGCDPRKADGRLFAEFPLYCEGSNVLGKCLSPLLFDLRVTVCRVP
jgi:hypothetical protein